MIDDRWLTYSAAATALGMTPESVRQRARREHWAKRLNNEGKATVLVPLDATGEAGGDLGEHRPVKRSVIRPEPDVGVVHQLQERVTELQAALDRERAELTRERERADRMVVELRAEAERERVERYQERDHTDQVASQMADLARRMVETMAEAEQRRARPWWRRLAS